MSFLSLETKHTCTLLGVIFLIYIFLRAQLPLVFGQKKIGPLTWHLMMLNVSIAVCMSTMLILPMFFEDCSWEYTLRLELVAIIP